MDKYSFSYQNYEALLKEIHNCGTLCDFAAVLKEKPDRYIILRHDVEFSPQRALTMAKLEEANKVKSSYFFQVTNNSYNILSKLNIDRVREIHSMGHNVGLHFHLNGAADIGFIKERIKEELEILSYYFGFEIKSFSFHRPPQFVLENVVDIPGIINAYDKPFFTFTADAGQLDFEKDVKYIADSKWTEWSYTSPYLYPTEEFLNSYKKIQILVHPFVWSEDGYGILDNLKSLLKESRSELINTIGSETKYAREYVDEL